MYLVDPRISSDPHVPHVIILSYLLKYIRYPPHTWYHFRAGIICYMLHACKVALV